MMEQLATGRQARSRHFTCEQLANGVGILVTEAPDFPKTIRECPCSQGCQNALGPLWGLSS